MDFRTYDAKALLKARKHWADDLKRLQQELDDMSMLPSVDNKTGVRSSDTSDLTASLALRRLKIVAEMEEIYLGMEYIKYALKSLTEEDMELIEGMDKTPRGKKGIFVEEYGRKYGLCDRNVREKYASALKKMGDAIMEEFYK